jgi:hypothetical protein
MAYICNTSTQELWWKEGQAGLYGETLSLKKNKARHQWLTPVILATQEAEIRRIAVLSQPKQTGHKTLSQKYPTTTKKRLVEWLKW